MRATGALGLTLLLALTACDAAPSKLTKAKVMLAKDGADIVLIDGKRVNYGFTGLGVFCVNGSSLSDLSERSVNDLRLLHRHYALCMQNPQAERVILDELVRRRDPDALRELASRTELSR